MRKPNHIKVIKSPGVEDGGMTLETSLSPFWKVSWYSGLLFDWCRPMPSQSRLSIGARCTIITIVVFFLTFYLSVYAHHLVTTAWQMDSIHEIIPFFIFFIAVFTALFEIIDYLIHRSKYLQFYTKWSQFEKEINFTEFLREKDRFNIKKIRYLVYGFYTLFFAGNFVFIGYLTLVSSASVELNEKEEGNFVFISDHPGLRKIIPYPTLELIQLVALTLTLYFASLTDTVSTFFYFHASIVVQNLKRNIDSIISNFNATSRIEGEDCIVSKSNTVQVEQSVKEIHKIWSRYEKLRGFVAKADALFGPTIIVNHGTLLLLCCITAYAVMRNFNLFFTNPDQTIYGSSLTVVSLRFVIIVLLTNSLGSSAKLLRISAVHLQSRHWFSLQPSEHNVLQNFIKQLEVDSMAAHPSDLYTVKPIIFLHVSTVITSYIIVLLQSK